MTHLDFTIRPGLSPLDRGEIEDLVLDALGEGAELLGGGGMLDGSESDFAIEVGGLDPEEIERRCREAFAGIGFSLPTTITLAIDARVVELPTGPSGDPLD